MRVKCPNSDIYLELPGDKMDMKFTCPACKKVHRVTITITTPGEIAPVAKAPPPMPRKYATGAYPPVVDIPIDADFVLFDESASQQFGIDLGQAAETPAPFVDRRMSERQTEIRRQAADDNAVANPPTPGIAPDRTPTATEPASDRMPDRGEAPDGEAKTIVPPAPQAEGKSGDAIPETPAPFPARDETPFSGETPAAAPEGAFARDSVFAERPVRRRPRRAARTVLTLFLVAVAAGLGYLAWQQYLFGQNRQVLDNALLEADRYAAAGDLEPAADAAGRAGEALGRNKEFHTVENLWGRLAKSFKFIPPPKRDTAATQERIAKHLARKAAYDSYLGELDSRPTAELADALATGLDRAGGDAGLALAMRLAAVDKALAATGPQGTATPEETLGDAMRLRRALMPLLDKRSADALEKGMGAAARGQAEALRRDFRTELADIDADAGKGDAGAVERYNRLRERIRNLPLSLSSAFKTGDELLDVSDQPQLKNLGQVAKLADLLDAAVTAARTTLSLGDPDTETYSELAAKAEAENFPNAKLAEETGKLIEDATIEAQKLLNLREDLFLKLQSENRRGKISPATMTAWRLLLTSLGNPDVAIDPAGFVYDAKKVEMRLALAGVPIHVKMGESDFEQTIRVETYGYRFKANWAPFFTKPLNWIADLAVKLRAAGINPDSYPDWEALEGPGGLVAITVPGTAASATAYGSLPASIESRRIFFEGRLYPVEEQTVPPGAGQHAEDFRRAAQKLHDGIMADESIPQPLRQALKPVLEGTYLPIDPRDYFDAAFCRRLIEADYLETSIKPLPPERKKELEAYRAALGKLEAGYDEFAVALDNGERLVAVANSDRDTEAGKSGDQDAFSGEIIPRYTWRMERQDKTIYYSPMPSRFNYSFSLAEHFFGRSNLRPAGVPALTEVWHATKGLVASYTHGDPKAVGEEEAWDKAIAADVGGPLNPVYGPPGWNFPLHVLEQNDQGDPTAIATLDGVVKSPDFSPAAIPDAEARRKAEDAWLDSTAKVFDTPGELGLIFHHFFRYCSDSPLPEMPNLIGSHYGLSDTHQTVYQSLERRWVGRLIGDCDDLAEFFQVLTSRQGKLSYVMNLPSHAACGYVDKLGDGKYRFIVLQTGQVLQFDGGTLNEVVEAAYRYFDRSAGESHLTMDAVPLLLRFADEQTRTPFVLSSRIYEDRAYAEAMIRVQAYWHENVLSAAIKEMREMLKTDKDVGNIKELGSLYERVGMYEESAKLRREELERVKNDPQAKLSTLLDIAQLHIQDKNKPEALKALYEMEETMLAFTKENNVPDFMRAMSFRSQWAILLSRLGEPARAWNLVKYDVEFSKRKQGHISEPVLRTLIVMYDKMSVNKAIKGAAFSEDEEKTMSLVGAELEAAFVRGVFESDDDYTRTIIRYFFLGRYAIAREGRAKGLPLLLQDGPYPTAAKDQTKRTRDITPEDWSWMRIVPQLYMAYGMEMLDQDEFPELYNPQGAKPLLEDVARAVAKGTGLGSDVAGSDDMIRADMTLSFINRDLAAFRKSMAVVLEKDYSKLYDDIAMTFGLNCGLIPLSEFDAWINAFRDYFPGKQHYFKVVYRAIDKENYDHALKMAEATAKFFPNDKLIVEEADFIRKIVPELKLRKQSRPKLTSSPATEILKPAA